jgi:hypothetical protein
MNRLISANSMGCLSVACSLAFWVWLGLSFLMPSSLRLVWFELVAGKGALVLWLVLWIAGLLMGLTATVLGSRRWIGAVILALVSDAVVVHIVSRMVV